MSKIDINQQLTVPIPRPTQYVYRGMKSTKVPDTNPISIRWTSEDHRFIDEQANRIGITFSEFVRWVAYHAAIEVRKLEYISSFKLSEPTPEGVKKLKDIDFSDWD